MRRIDESTVLKSAVECAQVSGDEEACGVAGDGAREDAAGGFGTKPRWSLADLGRQVGVIDWMRLEAVSRNQSRRSSSRTNSGHNQGRGCGNAAGSSKAT